MNPLGENSILSFYNSGCPTLDINKKVVQIVTNYYFGDNSNFFNSECATLSINKKEKRA